MKEYEIHVFVSYTSQGGTKEYDCFLEYIKANNASEAKTLLRAELKAGGYKAIRMEAIEC